VSRIVCWFSCGAASAVATKLAIAANQRAAQPAELVVARCRIDQEHADNDRFAADCARWFDRPIIELSSQKYGSSIFTVFERERYIAGIYGAACTRALKRHVREAFQRPDDTHVFGYPVEEQGRIDGLIDANNGIRVWAPLVEAGLTHDDCVAMVGRAGIEIPVMYTLGYEHNNCVGCVKGGAGYWNKIRVDFPQAFARMAEVERKLGVRLVRVGEDRVSLDNLPPAAGDMTREPMPQCGIFCEAAERDMNRSDTPPVAAAVPESTDAASGRNDAGQMER
jgi:hypothetical protein